MVVLAGDIVGKPSEDGRDFLLLAMFDSDFR
jgi:hypothetical protein